MGFFIQGLEDKSADLNHDERISILEACQQSAALTQADYAEKGLILTEHALIDDNGDRLGTRLAAGGREDSRQTPALAAADAQDPRDGNRASACYLKDYAFPVSVPREWVDSYLASLDAVEQLKRQKAKMDGKEYYAQLEKLLIKAATINRDIRSKIKS
jgi:hypothetical protein